MKDRLNPANLEQLRASRARPERDTSIAGVMASIQGDLRKRAKAVGSIGDTWMNIAPAVIQEQTTVVGITRGVLTIRAHNASAKFVTKKWLDSGGEMALIRATPVTLTKIKLV